MEGKGILYLSNSDRLCCYDFGFHCQLYQMTYLRVEEKNYHKAAEALQGDFELLLADYPLGNGELSQLIRKRKEENPFPYIALLEGKRESEQIQAFYEGADDVFCGESFSDGLRFLFYRMENLIEHYSQRENLSSGQWWISSGKISLNVSDHQVLLDDSPVHLTCTEWNILRLLCEKNGKVLSREAILDQCFEYQYEGYDRSIDTHIKNLRKKIPGAIGTERGVGYRFMGKESVSHY
ncbi:MAG: response regulator transcription factor [Spirochaetales bacterium]|nr:response regulator transcription factor [Spirochaetales bacterium]